MSQTMDTLGVIGAGTMGRGIAQVAAAQGLSATVLDVSADALTAGRAAIVASLDRAVERGKLTRDAADAVLRRIVWTEAMADLTGCATVIEAAPERLALKREIMAALDAALPAETPLATNTSSLSVAEIGAPLSRPGRLAGLHFFNPVPAMALVEAVGTAATEPAVLDHLEALARRLGKTPIRCADTPGFIVNRCARPFYGEALALLEEGRSAEEIDAACRAAGYRLGPFALIDLIGADVNLAATESLAAAFDGHPRYRVFATLQDAVAAGRLGRKSGAGFVTPAPAEEAPAPADAEAIVARIEATLVNEAAHLVDAGVAAPEAVDTALKLGLNFPRGPFEIRDAAGPAELVARLDALEAAAPTVLTGRYEAADSLRAAADPLWARLAPPERDAAYDNMGTIPGSTDYPPYWAKTAAAFRDAHADWETLSYGPEQRHQLDLFRPIGPIRGLVVFYHGGYWKRLDKSFWSHLAAGPLAAGCAVAIPSYRLAPTVRLTEILADARAALTAVAAVAPAGPIALVGHSAGGQLVTRLLCKDEAWPPAIADRLRGSVSISGLHDLRPLLSAPTHADLHLDAAEARALSPALHHPMPDLRHHAWVGGAELPAFIAQSEALGLSWAPLGAEIAVTQDPGTHHFTVLDGMTREDGPLCRAILDIAFDGDGP